MKTFVGEAQLGLQKLLYGLPTNSDIEKVTRMVRDAIRAQHFYVPDNGDLVGHLDHKYSMKGFPVRLPFSTITASVVLAGGGNTVKMVVIAKESVATLNNEIPRSPVIECRSALSTNGGCWVANPVIALIDTNACTRGEETACELRPFLSDADSLPASMLDPLTTHALAAASVLFNLLAALSCENVSFTSAGVSNPSQAAKSLAKNREPKYATRLLKIATPVEKLKIIGGEPSIKSPDCTRTGPKQHLRRGHIRTLPSGRRVWVNECLVGDESNGRLDKKYLVI